MERWILAVGYDKTTILAAHQEWLKHGVYVVSVADMQAAMKLLPRKEFLLVGIFSSNPPFEQIAELLKIKPVPVLIVSDEDDPEKKLEALRLGVADYIVWPGAVARGVEYGSAMIRQLTGKEPASPINSDDEIEICNLCMSPTRHSVKVNGIEVALTGKEFDILHLLMTRPSQYFTHQMIFRQVWGADHEDDDKRILNNIIYKLRAKLCVSHDAPVYIKNKKGVGYKFDP